MEYNFNEIEKRWQKRWAEMKTYHVTEDTQKRKFYVLNMFPYPSGAGLHVGHPLGYIASDIYARYKRQQGFNVLNPMRPAGRAVRHTDGTAPGSDDGAEHQPLPRAAGQNRLLVRLGQGGAHVRPEVLPLDAVGVHQDVQLILRQRAAEGQADSGA